MQRERIRSILLLALLCMSSACWSASFTAKVKLKLVSPANVTQDKAIEFGALNITNGKQCHLAAATGKLSGDACHASSVEKPVINISGDKDLSVRVNVSKTEADSGIVFAPTLFNGQNNHASFVLDDETHQVNLGGSLLVVDAEKVQDSELQFGVEVIYP